MSNKQHRQADSSPELLEKRSNYRAYTVQVSAHNIKAALQASMPEVTLQPGKLVAAKPSATLKLDYDLSHNQSHSFNPQHLDTAEIEPATTPVPEIATAKRERMSKEELEHQQFLRDSRQAVAEAAEDSPEQTIKPAIEDTKDSYGLAA